MSGKFLGQPGPEDDEVVPRFQFGLQTAPEDINTANLEVVLVSLRQQAAMQPAKTSSTIPEIVKYAQQHANEDFLLNAKATGLKNPFKAGGKKCVIS